MNKKELNYLSSCKDFSLLEKSFNKEMLQEFEKLIAEYENNISTVNSYSILDTENHIIINWYEGLITTEDLIDYYYYYD